MNIYLVVYYVVFMLISSLDYYRFRTVITPYIIFTLPFLLIITLVNTIGSDLGFFIITDRSILLFNLFTLVLWLGGMPFNSGTLRIYMNSENKNSLYNFDRYYLVLLYIGIISSLISLALNWNGLADFFNNDIENYYGRGFWGHLSIFGYPAVIMLMPKLIIEKNRSLLLLILIFAFLSIFYQSKTRLFFMILGGIFHYILITKKIFDVKKVLRQFSYVFIIAITIFFSVYLFSFSALMGKENVGKEQINFIITDRFLNYLVGPVISCSENFSLNKSFEEDNILRFLTVPYNIYALLARKELTTHLRDDFVFVSSTFSDNAATVFIYPYEAFGIVGTIIFMLGLGFISYYSYVQALTKTKNILFFSVLMSSLFLGFFGFFYNLLFFYEILLWGYMIPLVLKVLTSMLQLTLSK